MMEELNDLNYNAYLARAIEIFNEKMDADFSLYNVILSCFVTGNQEEVFEQFCTEYFPYRLSDRYHEEGYFDFRASSFIGMDNGGKDGILLRTDIPYHSFELLHIFLHELAHIYCAHHELGGKIFYDEYCEDYAQTKEEDGMINAGYAVWRECIAEIIAVECDDNCGIFPLREKKKLLAQFRDEINQRDGKLLVSEILTAVMTSSEIEASKTWEDAEKAIRNLKLFDSPQELDLMNLVFNQLREKMIEIDVNFISDLGFLYLNVLSLSILRGFQRF